MFNVRKSHMSVVFMLVLLLLSKSNAEVTVPEPTTPTPNTPTPGTPSPETPTPGTPTPGTPTPETPTPRTPSPPAPRTPSPTTPTPATPSPSTPTPPTRTQTPTPSPTPSGTRLQRKLRATLNGDLWGTALSQNHSRVVHVVHDEFCDNLGIDGNDLNVTGANVGSLIVDFVLFSQLSTSAIDSILTTASYPQITAMYESLTGASGVTIGVTSVTNSPTASSSSGSSCKGGCIAGIVIGVVAFFVLVGLAVWYINTRKATGKEVPPENEDSEMGQRQEREVHDPAGASGQEGWWKDRPGADQVQPVMQRQ